MIVRTIPINEGVDAQEQHSAVDHQSSMTAATP